MATLGSGKIEAVKEALLAISEPSLVTIDTCSDSLRVLEDYECWNPIFRYLQGKIQRQEANESDYVTIARICAVNLDNFSESATYCNDLVSKLSLSYPSFRSRVLMNLVGQEDFKSEALILEKVKQSFIQKSDVIKCLERLCHLYEKKCYDDYQLSLSYEELISVDPLNIKALRYFKTVYTQEQKWTDVVEVLERLYRSTKHKNDKYRIALELATVYLFQLDLPDKAIHILDLYCQGSPLDTSSIKYEAYYSLRNWSGCLNVLKSYLMNRCSVEKKSVVLFKIGELHELNGDEDSALQYYHESYLAHSEMLEPIENIVEIHVNRGRWNEVIDSLLLLRERVKDEKARSRIQETVDRILSGMSRG